MITGSETRQLDGVQTPLFESAEYSKEPCCRFAIQWPNGDMTQSIIYLDAEALSPGCITNALPLEVIEYVMQSAIAAGYFVGPDKGNAYEETGL